MHPHALLDIEDHSSIMNEIRLIASLAYAHFDGAEIDQVYADVLRLFRGEYPGYRRSNVKYHDLHHTMTVTLAVARLMHGALEEGCALTPKDFNIGIIGAFMHDTGYIQHEGDSGGTGAKYTLTHINRSIEFTKEYFQEHPVFQNDIKSFGDILRCTGMSTAIADIDFQSENAKLLGQMLGTADLLGQMADRRYPERLIDLYREFAEAEITDYASELDLLQKTRGFYLSTRKRLSGELGDVCRFARPHFRKRAGIDADLYLERIECNIDYLDYVLTNHPVNYRRYLRRSPIPVPAA